MSPRHRHTKKNVQRINAHVQSEVLSLGVKTPVAGVRRRNAHCATRTHKAIVLHVHATAVLKTLLLMLAPKLFVNIEGMNAWKL